MLPRTLALTWCCAPWLVFATPASCCPLVVRHPCVWFPWSRRLHCGSLCRGWVALVMVCYAGVIVVFVVPLLLVVIVSSSPPPLSSFALSASRRLPSPPLVVCPFLFSSFAVPPLVISPLFLSLFPLSWLSSFPPSSVSFPPFPLSLFPPPRCRLASPRRFYSRSLLLLLVSLIFILLVSLLLFHSHLLHSPLLLSSLLLSSLLLSSLLLSPPRRRRFASPPRRFPSSASNFLGPTSCISLSNSSGEG